MAQGDPIVVGAVGVNASGKDVVIQRLHRKYGVPMISMGDIVREIADEVGLPHDRPTLNGISERYFNTYGVEYFARRVADKIVSSGWKTAGVTGIRTPTDIRVMRDKFGVSFILIGVVVSDPRVRFERVKQRGEPRDPMTYDAFVAQDEREERVFQLAEAMSMADITLYNDSDIDSLYAQIDRIAEGQLGLRGDVQMSELP